MNTEIKDKIEVTKPPIASIGVIGWLRKNLFSSWSNTILTLLGIYILYSIIPSFISWAFIDASFVGSTKQECSKEGACWIFIKENLKLIFYGLYPSEELWRINSMYFILLVCGIYILTPNLKYKGWVGSFLLILFPILSVVMFSGGFGLETVETRLWGGLFLTLVIAGVGIVLSLPIGVMLALGRRSKLPVVSLLSTIFIEIWRGVPLITVLFMASNMFPLFMPEGVNFDKLIRALIGVMFFSAAYLAEVVRGGLQAMPKGQYEAAQAMGLSYWRMMALVILPQSLKMVIPAIIGSFIAIFKDTTLVLVIGLFDFLGIIQFVGTNPDWLGFSHEGYVFAAAIFWIFCFGMSRYSQNLEKKLDTGR
jgi:general L-amino acid transport system permease protein|tara:strand:- start:380 stop:1474 length:1095 start_codon:yes stop_codon:yes gene_type:complete